jgi:RNA polymerase sigma-70 factor (ECF subfamily)
MVRVCERVLDSREDAEDCASDALLAALRTNHQQVRNTEAWLVSVAKRRAVDQLRGRVRSRARHARLAVQHEVEAVDAAEAIAAQHEAAWLADEARARLSPACLAVVNELAGGASVEEAARTLGVTKRAVESQVYRARTVMQAVLTATLSVLGWLGRALRRRFPAAQTAALAAVIVVGVLGGNRPAVPLGPAPPAVDRHDAVASGLLSARTYAHQEAPPRARSRSEVPARAPGSSAEATSVHTAAGTTVVRRRHQEGPSDPVGIVLDCVSRFEVTREHVGC